MYDPTVDLVKHNTNLSAGSFNDKLARKNMGVNQHETIPSVTLRHKLK